MKQLQIQVPDNQRSAFTLLELLAVITIISILLALILPTLSGVLSSANETAVLTEMTEFDQALVTFKQEFGEYPPSSVTLYATAAEWNADPKSKNKIRSLWKDFDFSTGGRGVGHPWGTDPKVLTGDECLVFFLGGVAVPNAGDVPPTLSGFASNGRQPFAVAGGNRVGPFFEFKGERLIDGSSLESGTPDLLYSYTDGLGTTDTPIYYSAATKGRYSVGDAVYFQADGTTPWNKGSYQLIAPGEDGEFGDIEYRLAPSQNKPVWAEGFELGAARQQERDNLTNFSGGPLQR